MCFHSSSCGIVGNRYLIRKLHVLKKKDVKLQLEQQEMLTEQIIFKRIDLSLQLV